MPHACKISEVIELLQQHQHDDFVLCSLWYEDDVHNEGFLQRNTSPITSALFILQRSPLCKPYPPSQRGRHRHARHQ